MSSDNEATPTVTPATPNPTPSTHATSPSSFLPPEILIEIFKLLAQNDVADTAQELALLQTTMEIPPSASSLWNAAEVCPTWRAVAISTPDLWSNIVVDLKLQQLSNQQHDCRFHSTVNISDFRERIVRSGNTEITLQIRIRLARPSVTWSDKQQDESDYSSSSKKKKSFLVPLCVPVIRQLISCARRVSALGLWTNHESAIHAIYDFFTLPDLPILNSFRWNYLHYDQDAEEQLNTLRNEFSISNHDRRPQYSWVFRTAANLHKLELFDFARGSRWANDVCWKTITHLHLQSISAPSEFYQALSAATNLRDLKLACNERVFRTWEMRQGLGELPTLECLSLQGNSWLIQFLLHNARAPNLRTLQLAFESIPNTPPFSTQFRATITDLYLEFIEERHPNSLELLVKAVLLMTPSTKRLTLVSQEGMLYSYWLQATLKTLAEDGYICAELEEVVLYCKDGDAGTMGDFLDHRTSVQLTNYCHRVLVADGDKVRARRLLEEGRLRSVQCTWAWRREGRDRRW